MAFKWSSSAASDTIGSGTWEAFRAPDQDGRLEVFAIGVGGIFSSRRSPRTAAGEMGGSTKEGPLPLSTSNRTPWARTA